MQRVIRSPIPTRFAFVPFTFQPMCLVSLGVVWSTNGSQCCPAMPVVSRGLSMPAAAQQSRNSQPGKMNKRRRKNAEVGGSPLSSTLKKECRTGNAKDGVLLTSESAMQNARCPSPLAACSINQPCHPIACHRSITAQENKLRVAAYRRRPCLSRPLAFGCPSQAEARLKVTPKSFRCRIAVTAKTFATVTGAGGETERKGLRPPLRLMTQIPPKHQQARAMRPLHLSVAVCQAIRPFQNPRSAARHDLRVECLAQVRLIPTAKTDSGVFYSVARLFSIMRLRFSSNDDLLGVHL